MNRFTRKKILSPTAESLMEVIIAVGVLMLILGPAAGLYISSNRSAEVGKKRLVAEQLAEEGIEIIRSVRDTNAIRFKSKIAQCWLSPLTMVDLGTCQQQLLISGSYRVENTPTQVRIERFGPGNSLTDTLTGQSDPQYRLHLNQQGMYVINGGVDTPYYREVNLALTDIDNADGDNNNETGTDSLEVTSIVRFVVGSGVDTAIATGVLFVP